LHGLVDMNEGMNALINSHFDVALLGMNAPWFMREGSLVDPSILKKGLEPGRILEVSKDYGVGPLRENLQQMQVFDYMGPTFNVLQQYLAELGKRQSGATDPTIGGITPTGKTATEYMAAQQGAAQRFLFYANYITDSGLIPLVKNFIDLNAEYLSADTALSLTGTEEAGQVFVSRQDINRGCTVIMKPTANVNRLMTAKVITEFLPILMQYPMTNVTAVMMALVESLSEVFDDPAAIIPPQGEAMYAGQIQAMKNQQAEANRQTKGGKGNGQEISENGPMGDAEAEAGQVAQQFAA
jgi:hypothetical protein